MSRLRLPVYLLLLLVASTAPGCGKSELPSSDAPPTSAASSTAKPTEASQYQSATTEEVVEFARQLEQAFVNDDQRAMGLLIDWDAIAERATRKLGTAEDQKQMIEGLVSTTYGPLNLFNVIRSTGGPDVSYKFLRVKEEEGKQQVWFRVLGATGVNYHNFSVKKRDDRVRAVDIYILISGETLSNTWRRGLLPMVNEKSKNWLERLTTSESEYVRQFPQIQAFVQQVNGGQPQLALETYNRLPESVRNDKSLLLLRYRAALELNNEDEMVATANATQKAFPGDPCLDLLMIDSLFLRKEYDEAIACLDRLDKVVGGDSYLDFLRGSMYLETKDFERARENFKRAIATEPEKADYHNGLLLAALAAGDHDLSYDTLKLLRTEFDLTLMDLGHVPGYAAFAESAQGQKWLAETGQQ